MQLFAREDKKGTVTVPTATQLGPVIKLLFRTKTLYVLIEKKLAE